MWLTWFHPQDCKDPRAPLEVTPEQSQKLLALLGCDPQTHSPLLQIKNNSGAGDSTDIEVLALHVADPCKTHVLHVTCPGFNLKTTKNKAALVKARGNLELYVHNSPR